MEPGPVLLEFCGLVLFRFWEFRIGGTVAFRSLVETRTGKSACATKTRSGADVVIPNPVARRLRETVV
jgi:hypothetical protein